MKTFRALLFIVITAMAIVANAQTTQLAFPGADGYAKYTTGGRGGKVYYVTRLDDCSDNNLVPGTLRWALRTGDDTPRTILFNTCGTIYLTSKLKSNHPNVSILGQTAPGGGICITGYPLVINNRNYILRHLRFRAGEIPALEDDGNNSFSGVDIENAENVILDHCSVTWSMEECLTMFDNDNTTVQYCIVGEGLYHSYNVKTTGESSGRAFAMQWGGEHATMHHTLITNCAGRAPRMNGVREANAWLPGANGKKHAHDVNLDAEFVNNVLYNFTTGGTSYYGGEFYSDLFANAPEGTDAYGRVYMINNYYRPGPTTKLQNSSNRYFMNPSGDTDNKIGQWYLSGNKFETNGYYQPSNSNWSNTSLEQVNIDNVKALNLSSSMKEKHVMKQLPYQLSGYVAESADEAFLKVTNAQNGAGASLPRYDEVDTRLLNEASGRINGYTPFTGSRASNASSRPGIIDAPEDVVLKNGHDPLTINGHDYTCYPFLGVKTGDKWVEDADADGMPDAYETANGLDPQNPSDANIVAQNGYTNLENFLNAIADGALRMADYMTADTQQELGLAVRKDNITVTFATDGAEGTAPAPVTVAYGGALTMPASNTSLYKQGYTITGWSDGNMTFDFGKTYEGFFIDDVTLRPIFTKNIAELPQRNDEVTVTWDFTVPQAPKLEGCGIFVTQASVNATSIDVPMRYDGAAITTPASDGAVAQVVYANGTNQKIAATSDNLQITITDPASITKVIVVLPYTFDPTGITFHSPSVAAGTNFELAYFTNETDASKTDIPLTADWMQWQAQQQRIATRNSIDPVADNGTYYVASTEPGYDANVAGTTVTGPIVNQLNRVAIFVKDVAVIRTFVSGSCYDNGKSKDRVLLTAYPADGSDKIEAFNTHPLDKATLWSESFDVELDPEMSYMVVFSSINGYDMMLAAVKLFDKTAASASEGDGNIQWIWETEHNVEAVVEPAKIAEATQASFVGASSKGASSGTAWLRFPTITTPSDDYCISYTYTPAPGVSFTPQTVTFDNSAASECDFNVVMVIGDATPITVKTGEHVSNTAAASPTKFTYTVNAEATRQPVTLKIYPYNIVANKAFRLSHITISGRYDSKVQKHSFLTQVSPENAGAVMQTPKGSNLAEGTKVNLTATAASGYEFVNWTNLAGDVVDTNAEFVYTIGSADEVLTANFYSFLDSPVFTDGPFQAEVHDADELITALKGAAASHADRFRIFLHNGTYDFGTTAMTSVPKNTSLVGESQDGVIILNNPGPVESNYQERTPVLFIGEGQDNVYMQDVTVCQQRDWQTKVSTGQALAIRQRSKQAVYKNVTMQGVQDTYYLNKAEGTAYFEDCTIAGNVDYIYGDGTMWFEHCTMQHVGTGGYIVAPNTKPGYLGIVFNECRIEAENAGYYLGRPWDDSPAATFLLTTFTKLPNAVGWAKMTDGLTVRFHEYGSLDADGKALDLSRRSIAACNAAQGSDNPVIDAATAATYTLANVLPGWDPQALAEQVIAPQPFISKEKKQLTWTASEGAYGYAVIKNGAVIDFTSSCFYDLDDVEATYTLRALNFMGGLGIASAPAVDGWIDGISDIRSDDSCLDSIYNIAGQKVTSAHRGIVIINGSKFIKR